MKPKLSSGEHGAHIQCNPWLILNRSISLYPFAANENYQWKITNKIWQIKNYKWKISFHSEATQNWVWSKQIAMCTNLIYSWHNIWMGFPSPRRHMLGAFQMGAPLTCVDRVTLGVKTHPQNSYKIESLLEWTHVERGEWPSSKWEHHRSYAPAVGSFSDGVQSRVAKWIW